MSWTAERRKQQAEAIKAWRPWEKSTGPKTPEGKQRVSRNPWRGGHRQQLREIIRMVNAEVTQSRELLALV